MREVQLTVDESIQKVNRILVTALGGLLAIFQLVLAPNWTAPLLVDVYWYGDEMKSWRPFAICSLDLITEDRHDDFEGTQESGSVVDSVSVDV